MSKFSRQEASDIRARAFVEARAEGLPLPTYPGAKPTSIAEAYAIQDEAISAFPDTIAGWKVGGINGEWRDILDANRLFGPVFASYTHEYRGDALDMPVFQSGFAAVECEVTAIIRTSVPAGKTRFSTEDALDFIQSLHVGIEIASSPFPEINDHGPLVTISDFGNNRGLILGEEIPDWRDLAIEDWVFETEINGRSMGKAVPDGMPGGPIESVRQALENTSARSLPLQAGMKILTGAITGVHRAYAGDEAVVRLAGARDIHCRLVGYNAD